MPDITLTSVPVTWQVANQIQGAMARGANGYVEFEASAVAVHHGGLMWLPSPQRAEMVDGILAPINLPINDPDIWNWKVTPRLGVAWEPFHINVEEGGTDIAAAAIVPGKGPVKVVKGPAGASVVDFRDTGDGALVLVLSDGTESPAIPFTRGPAGPANRIEIGTVIRGEDAYASLVGEAPNQRLNLTLPKGDPGEPEDLNDATPERRGLMSATDKAHLDETPTRTEVVDSTRQTLRTTYSVEDNFDAIAPQYVTRLDVRSNDVLQAFGIDSVGRYYATQAYGDGAPGSMTVTRCDAGGRELDSAVLEGAGHGKPFGFEETEDGVFLWIWWNANIETTRDSLRRWKYTPGVTVNDSSSTVQKMPDYISSAAGFRWANVTISQRLDRIAFLIRTEVSGLRYDIVQMRSLSEYKAGTDRVIAQLPAINNNESGAFQGFVVTHDHCYIVRGLGGAWPQTARVEQHQWSDGALLHTKTVGHLAYAGVESTAKAEPESLFPLWDDAGRLSLLFALETGSTGKNIHSIYTLAPRDFQQDTGVAASLQRLYAPLRWIDVPLLPGFAPRTASTRLQAAKDANGMIHLRGHMAPDGFTSASATFARLPWGYRPLVETRWLGYESWGASLPFGGTITNDGAVTIQSDGTNPRSPSAHFALIVPPFQAEA